MRMSAFVAGREKEREKIREQAANSTLCVKKGEEDANIIEAAVMKVAELLSHRLTQTFVPRKQFF